MTVSARPRHFKGRRIGDGRIAKAGRFRQTFLKSGPGCRMAKALKAPRMLSHGQIWTALDRLAERAGLSASGLARRAGLDPTTFNKSKRITSDGRERWPSTESLAKALAATNSSIDNFVQLIGDGARTTQSVPLLGFSQAASGGHFDDSGFPAGKGWDEVALPSANDEHGYALEISGDALKPVYRDGDVIMVSPGTPIRRGDRVVVKTRAGEVMVKELKRRTAKALELQSLNPGQADRALAAGEVEWIARIVWASQ
jgi:phage repressor protein C with HTH and peptisase S24 domain